MKQHLQTLINLLTTNDIKTLLQHYLSSSNTENVTQLGFMFQQGKIKSSAFDYYQQLATSLIEQKGFPPELIVKIKTHDTLTFFTPVLQIKDNFSQTDHLQRNVLHYLFTNNQMIASNSQPPFNYLRSMMLFGSNEALRDALCQRDQQNLTPIEAYLFSNKNISSLANHELTALLALIEIESKLQIVDKTNYPLFIRTVGELCQDQVKQKLQRIMLIAAYFAIPVKQVLSDIK